MGVLYFIGQPYFQRLLHLNIHQPQSLWGQLATCKSMLLMLPVQICSGPALSHHEPQLLCTCESSAGMSLLKRHTDFSVLFQMVELGTVSSNYIIEALSLM